MNALQLSPRLQKAVDVGISGLDIIHGELKHMMLEAEEGLNIAQAEEDRTGEAMDSMDRKYWEGQLDALSIVYELTYKLSFAIGDKNA
jgi:hypothetical protein